jgi:hypothetical protein
VRAWSWLLLLHASELRRLHYLQARVPSAWSRVGAREGGVRGVTYTIRSCWTKGTPTCITTWRSTPSNSSLSMASDISNRSSA